MTEKMCPEQNTRTILAQVQVAKNEFIYNIKTLSEFQTKKVVSLHFMDFSV